MAQEQVTVYGAKWCHDTTRTLSQLDDLAVPYQYVDIDHDADAKQLITDWNNGRTQTPVVTLGAGEQPRLIEPTNDEMSTALRERGLVSTANQS